MTTATRPAIVGSGNIGSALARLFARAGLEISIANTRGPESISELASSIGPGVHAVPLEEALASDLIFMAIPFGAVEQFGTSLPDWTGKTVVDTTNAHYKPTGKRSWAGGPRPSTSPSTYPERRSSKPSTSCRQTPPHPKPTSKSSPPASAPASSSTPPLVRCLLVPALVSIAGPYNWWLPTWAARLLHGTPSPLHPTTHDNEPERQLVTTSH